VSVQFNPLLVGSLKTDAENSGVPVMGMIPLAGRTAETAIAGTVTVAAKELAVLVTDVAVTVTVRSLEGSAGAV
jgi:hypothetical protein